MTTGFVSTYDFIEARAFSTVCAHELAGRCDVAIFARVGLLMGLVAGNDDALGGALICELDGACSVLTTLSTFLALGGVYRRHQRSWCAAAACLGRVKVRIWLGSFGVCVSGGCSEVRYGGWWS